MSAPLQRVLVKACKVGRLTRQRVVMASTMPYSSAAMVSSGDAQMRMQMLLKALVMQSAAAPEPKVSIQVDAYALRDLELRRQVGTLEEAAVEEDLYARMDTEWRRQAEMKFKEDAVNKFDCVYDGLDARESVVEEDYYEKLERELMSQAQGY